MTSEGFYVNDASCAGHKESFIKYCGPSTTNCMKFIMIEFWHHCALSFVVMISLALFGASNFLIINYLLVVLEPISRTGLLQFGN